MPDTSALVERPRDMPDPGERRKRIGREIKRYRILKGLTQREVCELTGIKLNTYQEYEQGRAVPSGERLLDIMAVCDIPASALADMPEDQTP